ncbi:MAG TPA: SUMF1/EgtB/PvdO family nonheme iron enzyme, partial [Prolixibacteraceae bacterium]|nr:SUMF1/EgtB/PvdO family nonheme iron enzyme [Prolixibacteraceae bacterium]
SDVGWFVDNSDGSCQYKGSLMPNQLGIYDMCGNVWEWCYDNYDKEFYKRNSDSTDPECINGSGKRVNRGGSWSSDAQYCRITNRNYLDEFDYNPFLGFRMKIDWTK